MALSILSVSVAATYQLQKEILTILFSGGGPNVTKPILTYSGGEYIAASSLVTATTRYPAAAALNVRNNNEEKKKKSVHQVILYFLRIRYLLVVVDGSPTVETIQFGILPGLHFSKGFHRILLTVQQSKTSLLDLGAVLFPLHSM